MTSKKNNFEPQKEIFLDLQLSKIKNELFNLKEKTLIEFANSIKKDNPIYSENLGYLDIDHILFFMESYKKVFQNLEKALSEKKATYFQLNPDNLFLKYKYNLKLEIDNSEILSLEQKNEIIRDILVSTSLLFENKNIKVSNYFNRFLNFLNKNSFGTFSIEDLPSNGLGMFGAEEYIKDPSNFIKTYSKPTFDEKLSTEENAIVNYILSFSKKHIKKNSLEDKILTKNKTFVPKIDGKLDENNLAIKYLMEIDKIRSAQKNTKKGQKYGVKWELNNVETQNKIF